MGTKLHMEVFYGIPPRAKVKHEGKTQAKSLMYCKVCSAQAKKLHEYTEVFYGIPPRAKVKHEGKPHANNL